MNSCSSGGSVRNFRTGDRWVDLQLAQLLSEDWRSLQQEWFLSYWRPFWISFDYGYVGSLLTVSQTITFRLSQTEKLAHIDSFWKYESVLDSSKLKEFADDNIRYDENGRKFSKWVENYVEKGEITCYKQFLLFTHSFQKPCSADM